MSDFYRLKIVSKRQVTLPLLMLEALHLQEGDELEVEVENGEVVAVRPLKLVPATLFTKQMLKVLEARSKSMDAGDTATANRPHEQTTSDALVEGRIARFRDATKQAVNATKESLGG